MSVERASPYPSSVETETGTVPMIPCNEFNSLADFPAGAVVRSSAEYMQSALRWSALERGLGVVRATYYGGRYGDAPLVEVQWGNGEVSSIHPRWLARVQEDRAT